MAKSNRRAEIKRAKLSRKEAAMSNPSGKSTYARKRRFCGFDNPKVTPISPWTFLHLRIKPWAS